MVEPVPILWFADTRGINIPREFAFDFSRKQSRVEHVEGVTTEQFRILEEGPTHDDYWGTWDDVLRDCCVVDRAGNKYTLHQDGDLWLIPVGMEWSDDAGWIWPTDKDTRRMPIRNDPIDVFNFYNMKVGPDKCWVWHGTWGGNPRELRPYFMAGRRRQVAYRWVYELVHGVTLAPDQPILHSCDCGGYPTGCGNPTHLRLGTREENTNDMISRERHGLPKTVVRAIRKLLADGKTQEEVANIYGIARTTVSAIATNRSHQSID